MEGGGLPVSLLERGAESASWAPRSLSSRARGLTVAASACPSCSDDEDVAPLSAKFADIYPLSNYDDAEVVANMNGIHSELNGGGENLALKDEVRAGQLGGDNEWHEGAPPSQCSVPAVSKSEVTEGCF